MDWWDQIGNFAGFFPTVPALAADFALNGADPDTIGYGLADALQAMPAMIDAYPLEG